MKKRTWFSLILAALLSMSLLLSCGTASETTTTTSAAPVASDSQTESEKATEPTTETAAESTSETATEAETTTETDAETETETEPEGTDETPVELAEVNIGVLKGPTGMGASYMFEKNANGETAAEYAVTLNGDTTGHFTTTDTFLLISNLMANASYSVQVRSVCSGDTSLPSPTVSFTTPCEAITITETTPWTEDFEGYAGSGEQPFQCWATPVQDASYHGPFVYCGHAPSCHSGANSAELKGYDNMLVLPPFNNDIQTLRLSFWATSTAPLYGTLEVGVLTNVSDPGSFELVGTADTPGPRGVDSSGNGNFMGYFDFGGVTATNARIALRYSSHAYPNISWNLDDFVVELAPDCPVPSDVTVTNITSADATVTWSATTSASEWSSSFFSPLP